MHYAYCMLWTGRGLRLFTQLHFIYAFVWYLFDTISVEHLNQTVCFLLIYDQYFKTRATACVKTILHEVALAPVKALPWRHLASTVERLLAAAGGSATCSSGGGAACFQVTLDNLVMFAAEVLLIKAFRCAELTTWMTMTL